MQVDRFAGRISRVGNYPTLSTLIYMSCDFARSHDLLKIDKVHRKARQSRGTICGSMKGNIGTSNSMNNRRKIIRIPICEKSQSRNVIESKEANRKARGSEEGSKRMS